MAGFLHPLLLLLARASDPELVRMIEYLKAENRILRGKLPKRITAEFCRILESVVDDAEVGGQLATGFTFFRGESVVGGRRIAPEAAPACRY